MGTNTNRVTAMHMSYAADKKAALVERLIDAKASSKLTFDEISTKLGITNAQTAQLFTNQAQLSPRAAALLKVAVPGISAADLVTMQQVPMRSFDPEMMQVIDILCLSLRGVA
jgi:cyanate lyase